MTFNTLFKNGFSIGFKNLFPLIGTLLLYILTCWIPYINVGTTIAVTTLPASMARGESIDPTSIFDAKYRNNMGNFFILVVLMTIGLIFGFYFLIVPGLVLTYAWSFAYLLLVDKGLNPMQALHESNEKTNGYKWILFFANILLAIIGFAVIFIVSAITAAAGNGAVAIIGGIFMFVLFLAWYSVSLGMQAEAYKQLVLGEEK